MVGDTAYCDYPPQARRVAKIGDVRANYERVVALRPDLVIGDVVATSASVTRLSQLRLPVFAVRPDTLNGVEQSIRQLGQITGTSHQARLVVAQMEAKRHKAEALVIHDPRSPRVLIVIGTNPLFMAGRGTFLDDIVTEAAGPTWRQSRGTERNPKKQFWHIPRMSFWHRQVIRRACGPTPFCDGCSPSAPGGSFM